MEENVTPTQQKLAKVDYYLRVFLRRRWFVIIPFCVAMVVGIHQSMSIPETFSADNLIIIVPKSVPDKYVPTIEEPSMRQRIDTIKEQVLSRSNLTAIMEKLGLFSEPDYRNLLLEEKLELMRRNTSVDVSKSERGGATSFRIVYKGRNPKTVQMVVNTLAETFITESVKVLQEEALQLNKFLEGEVIDFRKRLESIEVTISDYRKEHLGELPEELASNLNMLQRLQEEVGQKQENLRDAKNRLSTIETRIAEERKLLEEATAPVAANLPVSERERLRMELNLLEARYTDLHPDVVRLRHLVERKDLEEREAASASASMETAPPPPPATSKLLAELATQQKAVALEIQETITELGRIEESIRNYQARVENTPKREQYLNDLWRNYTNIERTYKNFLEKKLESDIAVNLQRKQKGEKFQVIDKAQLPSKPISPDLKRLFALFTGGGIVVGFAIIILLEIINPCIKFVNDLETDTGIPVLATIPQLHPPRGFFYRGNQILTVVFLIVALTLFTLFGFMSMKGVTNAMASLSRVEDRISSFLGGAAR